ncbi:MAG: hypothetical protein HDS72_09410 [Bacteroidales bacterium]|nr:hypothetical protein [Bacteroidales bacterium]
MTRQILTLAGALAFSMTLFAEKTTHRLELGDFSELVVVDGVKVNHVCNADSAGIAVFSCEPDKASQITFNNNGGKLTIQTTAETEPYRDMPTVTVYSSTLSRAENSGDSLLCVNISAPVKTLKIHQMGNGAVKVNGIDAEQLELAFAAGKGTMEVAGRADKAKIRNVGTGTINATDLTADDVNCFIFGTGDITLGTSDKVKIYGAGNGKVIYDHAPGKITNRSIGVKALSLAEMAKKDKDKAEILTAKNK